MKLQDSMFSIMYAVAAWHSLDQAISGNTFISFALSVLAIALSLVDLMCQRWTACEVHIK